VRCATSYEAVLAVGTAVGTVETFSPSSKAHSQAKQGVDWHLLEDGAMQDEPLELPGPISMQEPLAQTDYVLEDLLSVSPFKQEVSLPLTDFAHAQAESMEEVTTEEEILSLEDSSSFAPEETAQEETAWLYEDTSLSYDETALPSNELPSQDASSLWSSEEDGAWASEALISEALTSEETLPSSEVEVSSESETVVSFESENEAASLSLVSTSTSSLASSSSSSSFEAEVLPASETETERHNSLLDQSQAPDGVCAVEEQPVGFVNTAKDVLPYAERHSLGVRLMRVSPVWLLGSGLLFISLIFAFNWATKPNAQANNLTFEHSLTDRAANTETQQAAAPAPARTAEQTNVGANQNPSTDANVAAPVNPASPINAAPLANAAPSVSPAQVVNDAPAANPAPEVRPSQIESQIDHQGSGNFTVQVGSYNDRAQALERAANLRSAGFDVRLAEVQLPKRGTWYRVQSGRFGTREEATRYGQQLRAQKVAAETIITETQNQ
jgi:cell division protein FtsN